MREDTQLRDVVTRETRDTPKRPVKLMKGLTAYCPICSGWVGYEYRYCPSCGQKIWRKKYDEKEREIK